MQLSSPVRGRVRQAGWVPVGHGLHQQAGDDPLLAWQLVLPPSGAFTGLTAAERYGWWLPPLPPDLPVFASQSTADPRPRRSGLRVARHPVPPRFHRHDGLRLAAPAEALLACARLLSLLDLVVVADSALHAGSCTTAELQDVARPRRAGAPLLREALALADGRSESPWESVLRMLHVACGVEVEPQHVVLDGAGRFVARGDLWLVGTRVLHEYDGAVHLDRQAQRSDLRRARRINNIGWVRRGYTASDVIGNGLSILHDADRSLGRPHDPARIKPWHRLVAESLFTPTGTALFRQRLLRKNGR